MKRRDLLIGTLAVGSMAALAARGEEDFAGILDTNVNLFRWPFRRLPLDETEKLVAKMRALGITKALAGSFEGESMPGSTPSGAAEHCADEEESTSLLFAWRHVAARRRAVDEAYNAVADGAGDGVL